MILGRGNILFSLTLDFSRVLIFLRHPVYVHYFTILKFKQIYVKKEDATIFNTVLAMIVKICVNVSTMKREFWILVSFPFGGGDCKSVLWLCLVSFLAGVRVVTQYYDSVVSFRVRVVTQCYGSVVSFRVRVATQCYGSVVSFLSGIRVVTHVPRCPRRSVFWRAWGFSSCRRTPAWSPWSPSHPRRSPSSPTPTASSLQRERVGLYWLEFWQCCCILGYVFLTVRITEAFGLPKSSLLSNFCPQTKFGVR